MKRYYVAAVFFIIMGGLLAYIRFHQGNTEGAIWIGIICTLLGVFAFCYEKFRPRLKLVAIAYNVIFIGLMAAYAASTGDIAWAIFLGIGSIGGCVLHFFQDTPFVKEKIRLAMTCAIYWDCRFTRFARCVAAFTFLHAIKSI